MEPSDQVRSSTTPAPKRVSQFPIIDKLQRRADLQRRLAACLEELAAIERELFPSLTTADAGAPLAMVRE